MPYKEVWVKPKVFMTYRGVKVFHTYKNDDADDQLQNWFSVNQVEPEGHEEKDSFDVRHLTAYTDLNNMPDTDERRKLAIRNALKSGELKPITE